MYDDASYYYSQYNAPAQQKIDQKSARQDQKKQSLLETPSVDARNTVQLDQAPPADSKPRVLSPPKAVLARRARSYAGFRDAAYAVLDVKIDGGKPKLKAGRSLADLRRRRRQDRGEIANDSEFGEWYNSVEEDLVESYQDEYTTYQKQLAISERHVDELLADTAATLALLDKLVASFRNVEVNTSKFQGQCQELLSDQQRLEYVAKNVDLNLKYYNYLEPATRRLNAPGAGSMVRGKEFSDMLTYIDECLDYMRLHRSHKEAVLYESRYRQLMTRGLTLIRVNFVNGIRDIASDVSRRIADKQLNDTTMSALLYAKFRVGAAELKELAQEIRKRTLLPLGAQPGQEAEYQSLMNELYTSYSATRGKLVIPLARKKINSIAISPSTSKDLVVFARSSIGYIRGVCSDEHGLWREWFADEEGMFDFLESVCEPLFDHLRPRIIHETNLLKLCELCTLLQTRYVHDQDEDAEPLDSNQLNFSILVHPALEDAQTRLVFRTQAILRDEIERFKPKKEDIDYPARNKLMSLSGTKSATRNTPDRRKSSVPEPTTPMPKTPMIVDEGDSPNGYFGFDTEAAFDGWYPTLRTAIWLLSRIYRLVNSTVFDDLAHSIVHVTTLSLVQASTLITPLPHRTPHDGRLFLIKHLLILKSQIVAFDIEYVTPDISFDFSNLTNTFYELRERGGLFDPRNLWRLLSSSIGGGLIPQVVENMFDAKVELDGRLRSIINEFTLSFANSITAPVNASAIASPRFDALAAVSKIKEIAGKELTILRQKLNEYLDDVRTKDTLVTAVQELVIQDYETFYEAYTSKQQRQKADAVNGTSVGKTTTTGKNKKGKGRDDEVWDVDMFSEWAAAAFVARDRVVFRAADGEILIDDDGDDEVVLARGHASRNGSL